jgi:hypothetical protein
MCAEGGEEGGEEWALWVGWHAGHWLSMSGMECGFDKGIEFAISVLRDVDISVGTR